MARSRDRGKKEKKKAPKEDAKKKKGVPPHLQRTRDTNNSLREIQHHLDDLAERQK
jgi:hypothetical protein